jgi:hypothetical protein
LIDVTTTHAQHSHPTHIILHDCHDKAKNCVGGCPLPSCLFPKSGGGDTVESNMVVQQTSQILIGMESGLGKRSATDQSKEALFGR